MTEQEWLSCSDPTPMLEFLRGKASDRKRLLLECGRIRLIWWNFLSDERSKDAVDVAEKYADGRATNQERETTWQKALDAHDAVFANEGGTGFARVSAYRVQHLYGWSSLGDAEIKPYLALLRDIVGPLPFRPIVIDTDWLTPTVKQLAEATYESRDFSRLPVLADALEDGGCAEPDILNHCRQPGVHTRGCWALDLVLGNE